MSSMPPVIARPPTADDLKLLVRKVISSYPSVNPVDVEGYLKEIVTLLRGYSVGVAEAGVAKAMDASPAFPPPIPLVKHYCDELIASSRAAFEYARTWEEGARAQLRERRAIERELEAEPLAHRRAVVERVMGELSATRTPEPTPVDPWKPLSAEELLAKYPKRQEDAA